MANSPNLALLYLTAEQAQKHVTVNEALRALDALVQLSVRDRDLAAPPAPPVDGTRYIVAAAPTGAWAGRAGDIAAWQDGAWAFYEPREGWLAWVDDEDTLLAFNGAAWVAGGAGSELQNITRLGINTLADVTNPVSAVINKALWAARTALAGGNGDLQFAMSKESAADTLSLLMQTAFSGRAEIGLAGDDNLSFKVSADGAAWKTGLVLDRNTGRVSFPSGGAREVLPANCTYYVRTDGSDANTGLTNAAGGAFLTIQKAIDTVAALDISTFNVTIQVGNGTFSSAVVVTGAWQGSGTVSVQGENATGAAISRAGDCIKVRSGGRLTVSRMKVAASVAAGLKAETGGSINVGADFEFGACQYGAFVYGGGSVVTFAANYALSGGGDNHYIAQNGGLLAVGGGLTVAISGSPAFAGAFAEATITGMIFTANMTYSGAVTGRRHNVTLNGVIQTFGGGANFFPGSIAGTTATGGQFA